MATDTEENSYSAVELGNEQFRLLVEAFPFGVLITSREGTIVAMNQFAEGLLGYRREELRGRSVTELVEGGLPVSPGRLEVIGKADAGTIHSEGRVRHCRGDSIPVEMALSPLPCGGQLYILATLTDITEKRENENRLAFLADVMERLYEGVIFLDEEGRICFWNSGAAAMFDAEDGTVMGAPVDEIIEPRHRVTFRDSLLPEMRRAGRLECSLNLRDSSNALRRIMLKGAPIEWDERRGSIWLAKDVTREARLEAEIVKVAENEQRRIGEDIHDDLCSQLSAIGCLIEVFAHQFSDPGTEAERSLARIAEMVSVAGEAARNIAAGLAPAAMNGGSLAGAIRALVATRGGDPSTIFRVTIRNEEIIDQLGEEKARHLYRIAQEAVNNAIRHGEASEIHLNLSADDSSLRLLVSDNGLGIEPERCLDRCSVSRGMGLSTMRHRTGIMGGRFELSSSQGEGTRMECTVPVGDC